MIMITAPIAPRTRIVPVVQSVRNGQRPRRYRVQTANTPNGARNRKALRRRSLSMNGIRSGGRPLQRPPHQGRGSGLECQRLLPSADRRDGTGRTGLIVARAPG